MKHLYMGIAFYASFAIITFMLAPAHWTSAKNGGSQISPHQAHETTMHNAASNVLPGLLTPPAVQMGTKGYDCSGEIEFLEPSGSRDMVRVKYKHNCRPSN